MNDRMHARSIRLEHDAEDQQATRSRRETRWINALPNGVLLRDPTSGRRTQKAQWSPLNVPF
jgi:hypothetical protein